MVKLRLMRIGRKKRPYYRIVAMEVNTPRDGTTLGLVGHYDPLGSKIDVDKEAALLWLNRGAQMTPTVKSLFHNQGVLAHWKGLEFEVREDALTRDKPKRRRKLAAAAGAAEEASATEEETAAEETSAAEEAAANGEDS
ncbi:MAG: 30S ribosomal protein S16 [Gemmatimonadetes bacterium]|nr:30S ribosomal protein S16 [Gemmatimonadota bacterium]